MVALFPRFPPIKLSSLKFVQTLSKPFQKEPSSSKFSQKNFLKTVYRFSAGVGLVVLSTSIAYAKSSSAVDPSKTNPSQLFVWGSNTHQTVPECSEPVVLEPQPVPFFDTLGIRDIQFAEKHAACIDKNGNVYVWGALWEESDKKQTHPHPQKSTPKPVLMGENITSIACTENSIYALSSKGAVFVLEVSTVKSLLPFPQRGWFQSSPVPTMKFPASHGYSDRVVKIVSGKHHLLALCKSGKVYSAAESPSGCLNGQMGVDFTSANLDPKSCNDWKIFHHVQGVESYKFIDIAAGNRHSLILSSNHRVFAFGSDQSLQLGLGDYFTGRPSQRNTPELLKNLLPQEHSPDSSMQVVKIRAGGDSSFFYRKTTDDAKNELLAAGNGLYGVLGTGHYQQAVGSPTKVSAFSKYYYDDQAGKLKQFSLLDLSLGDGHAIANIQSDPKGSSLWFWGYNKFGQCGTGNVSNLSKPILAFESLQNRELDNTHTITLPPLLGKHPAYAASAGACNSALFNISD